MRWDRREWVIDEPVLAENSVDDDPALKSTLKEVCFEQLR